jgi:hypothetical protein
MASALEIRGMLVRRMASLCTRKLVLFRNIRLHRLGKRLDALERALKG